MTGPNFAVYVVATMKKKKKVTVKLADVERLARLQCTHREAAGFLDMRVATFRQLIRKDSRVRDAWERGQQMGLVSLRRKQMGLASVNATMAIFLGKQYLGQRDVVTNEHTGADGGPIGLGVDLSKLSKAERDDLRSILGRATQSGQGAG